MTILKNRITFAVPFLALFILLLIGQLMSHYEVFSENKPATFKSNRDLVKTYFEHFNKHEWDKMTAMYSETVEVKDPYLGKSMVKQTKKQINKHYSELNRLFPNIKDEIVQIYPSGAGDKHIIAEFISSGTGADGTDFQLPICVIFTFENGKIIKDFSYYDNFEE